MIPADLPFDASATLLWFPSGQTRTDADFEPQDTDPRAEKYWFRHEAVIDAVEAAVNGTRPPERDPWIKCGQVVSALANTRGLHPSRHAADTRQIRYDAVARTRGRERRRASSSPRWSRPAG